MLMATLMHFFSISSLENRHEVVPCFQNKNGILYKQRKLRKENTILKEWFGKKSFFNNRKNEISELQLFEKSSFYLKKIKF